MRINPEQVTAIAELARLELSQEQLKTFTRQFDTILQHMDQLKQLDTQLVEPLFSPVESKARLRTDTAEKPASPEEILSNAPESDGEYFIVPRMV